MYSGTCTSGHLCKQQANVKLITCINSNKEPRTEEYYSNVVIESLYSTINKQEV